MTMQFTKAVKTGSKLRLALAGPSGSGKTYTALRIATGLGGKIAVIDTEHGSASKYADEFDFDVLNLESFEPGNYIEALGVAVSSGYDVVVIDSLSHAWAGKGGALEMVDKATKASKSKNSYMAWGKVTPLWNDLITAIVRTNAHVIGTLRVKTDYVIEQDDRGKSAPRKVGLAPVIRDGVEYEFDVVGELDLDHTLVISKTRCRAIDGAVIEKPGSEFAVTLSDWLDGAAPAHVEQIDDLGTKVYGAEQWRSELREASARWASGDVSGSIEQLTPSEAANLRTALTKRLDSNTKTNAASNGTTTTTAPEDAGTDEGGGGDDSPRPRDPVTVRESLIEAAAKKSTGKPSDAQVQKTRLDMAGLWPEDDERRAVLAWLFGVTSTKDLTAGQCSVVIDWIGSSVTEDGEWIPARHVEAEAGAMLTAARKEEHGGELFGDDGTIKAAALEPGGVAE